MKGQKGALKKYLHLYCTLQLGIHAFVMLNFSESVLQVDPAATLPAAAPQPYLRFADSEEVDSAGEDCLANPLAHR